MDTQTIGSTDTEQEWIQKYRATLDGRSRKESKLKTVGVVLVNIAKILILGLRSVLTKRAGTANRAASTQATKIVPASTSTMLDRGVQCGQDLAIQSAQAGNIFHFDAEVPQKAS